MATRLNKFAAEFDAVLSALADQSLTPEGRARRLLAEIEKLDIPPEREDAVRDVLGQLAAFVRDQRARIADQSALVREAADFYRAARALAQPAPVLTSADVVRGMFNALQEVGWGSGAIGLLEADLKSADLPIRTFDATSITTAARRINLEDLIVRHRPRSMTAAHYEGWRKSNMRPEHLTSRSEVQR